MNTSLIGGGKKDSFIFTNQKKKQLPKKKLFFSQIPKRLGVIFLRKHTIY